MLDTLTDASTEGIFTRLKNALADVLIGALLVFALLGSSPGINQYGPSPRNVTM